MEGQSLGTGAGREERDDGQVVNLPFTSVPSPLLAAPDPGRRNAGSHSTDEETEFQRGVTPPPILPGVPQGLC